MKLSVSWNNPKTFLHLKGVEGPSAFAMVCLCFHESRIVSYSGRYGEQVADFAPGILLFELPLKTHLQVPFSNLIT